MDNFVELGLYYTRKYAETHSLEALENVKNLLTQLSEAFNASTARIKELEKEKLDASNK